MSKPDSGALRAALRAAVVSQLLAALGPDREADAEWLAEQALKYQDVLLAAAGNVLPVDPEKLTRAELLGVMRGHLEGVVHTSFLSLLMAARQAAALGACGKRHAVGAADWRELMALLLEG
jgi:hypothetical protein